MDAISQIIAVVVGNIGKDRQVMSYTPNGKAVTSFSVATYGYGEGKRRLETMWIQCKAWEGLAEAVNRLDLKGQKLRITGKFWDEHWQDKEGNKRITHRMNVSKFEYGTKEALEFTLLQENSLGVGTSPLVEGAEVHECDVVDADGNPLTDAAKKRIEKEKAEVK